MCIRDRHNLLGFEVKGDKNFTLGDLVNEGVTAHADAITVIATNATQESVLEEMMAKARVPCHESSPGMMDVGGLRSFNEPIRTASRPLRRVREHGRGDGVNASHTGSRPS